MERRFISTILIIIGFMVVVYPQIEEFYDIYRQQKLLSKWQQSLSIIDREAPAAIDEDVWLPILKR